MSSETSASLYDQIWGLEIGLQLFGLQMNGEIFRRIERARGWNNQTSFGSEPDMRAKGLTETQIFYEYLSMYIETWKRMLAKLEQDGSE
ncbi:MAG: hypothetical protein U0175_13820 [Caldilineaceae bacterium]